MMLDNLVSKVLAAGLAAGVFLLWWPAHLPASGVEWLVLRGVAWTLVFELLAVSFSPLERMAASALARRTLAARVRDLRGRLGAAPPPARAGGAMLLASTALAVPAMLLAHADRPPARPAPRPVTLVRKVVVRREVVRRKTVLVRAPAVVAPAPRQPASPQTTATTAPPTTEPAPKTAGAARGTKARKRAATTPAAESPPTTTAPAPATTPAADPAVAAGPADAAAPADQPTG
jgi:hypothetical protein